MINIYNKRGKKNYKELKLLKDLEPIIEKKISEDPSLEKNFVSAKNFDELKRLHNFYVSDEVEFEEINEETKNMAKKDAVLDDEELKVNDDSFYEDEVENTFIDPFNREEPIVRDYVTDGGMEEDSGQTKEPNRTQFDEPISWSEAFELPSDEDGDDMATPQGKNQNQKQSKQKPEPKEPMNPHFDDMSSGKKRRSTKKFATYIVETVCMLAEKGFVWYANKDINESKLAEYEMSGEMDLSLLVTLEDGQEATVKQFFLGQTLRAEQLAKIDPEEKKDLAEVLAEVLLEKGIAPTASQELILIGFKIFGAQAIQLFALKSQTNALLSQLRDMHSGTPSPNNYDDIPSEEPTYEAPSQQVSQPNAQPQEELSLSDDDLIIEKVIETKE